MLRLYGAMTQRRHAISEPSGIGAARRDGQRLAAEMKLEEDFGARVGLVITELATNLLRHAGRGEIFLQVLPCGLGTSIQVLSIDRGPGMRDIGTCLQDGYSSRDSLGAGLGAVTRLADEFDISSVVGKGTIVMARVGAPPADRFGAICAAKEGEAACGDTWRLARDELGRSALIVIDGLGHGLLAADAAQAAATAFESNPFALPKAQIERLHRALHGTRGAAVACATWGNDQALRYAGVGNISGRLAAADGQRGLVSHNGTLGLQLQRVQQFEYPLQQNVFLIMHSDGISARWQLEEQFATHRHHPAVTAAIVYRDHGRMRDDATIVVIGL